MIRGAETHEGIVRKAFEKTLNSHGYGFHYAVLELAMRLYGEDRSGWLFEAAEFPVEVQGADTRIDFLLRRKEDRPFFLVAECKRANPALSHRCFVRAPLTHRGRWGTHDPLALERVWQDDTDMVRARVRTYHAGRPSYHVAVEVKSGGEGDSSGRGRGAVEDAATQVVRGVNGMIELAVREPQLLRRAKVADFLPVIFTTARLWSSDINLGLADIERGEVDLTSAGFGEADWLLLQYNVSHGLKHRLRFEERPPDMSAMLVEEHTRTIAVVSATGVEAFLEWSSHLDIH